MRDWKAKNVSASLAREHLVDGKHRVFFLGMTTVNNMCLHGPPTSRGLRLAPLRSPSPQCNVEELMTSVGWESFLIDGASWPQMTLWWGWSEQGSRCQDKPHAYKSHGNREVLAQYQKGKRVMDRGQTRQQAIEFTGSGPVPNILLPPCSDVHQLPLNLDVQEEVRSRNHLS